MHPDQLIPPPYWNADGEPENLAAAASDALEWLELLAIKYGHAPQNLLDCRDDLRRRLAMIKTPPPKEQFRGEPPAPPANDSDIHTTPRAAPSMSGFNVEEALSLKSGDSVVWSHFDRNGLRNYAGTLTTMNGRGRPYWNVKRSDGKTVSVRTTALRRPKKAPWPEDAPEGKCWECPDCGSLASLGGNAGFHRDQAGHKEPRLINQPPLAI